MINKGFNFIIALLISALSVGFFFLAAEVMTRLYDSYLAKTKVSQAEYDWSSRLEGYSINKKEGIFRILVLGDSTAYGQGVKRTETFSKRLEEMLNNDGKGRFEVINSGFCGIDTMQELEILLNNGPDKINRPELPGEGYQGMAYRPDMILLQYTVGNDAQWYGPGGLELYPPHRWKDGVRRYNYGDYAIPLSETIDRWLTKNSRFYLFFLNKYHGFLTRLGLRNEVDRIRAMYQPHLVGWQRSAYALGRIGEIARANSIPAVIVIWATGNDNSLADVHKLVGSVGRERGFHVLDLAEAVEWPKEDFAVSKTDGHPNAKAHNIAAEAIYKFIKGEGLVSE